MKSNKTYALMHRMRSMSPIERLTTVTNATLALHRRTLASHQRSLGQLHRQIQHLKGA